MPQFRFRATDAQGKIRQGRLTAANHSDAELRVQQSGLTVLELYEVASELVTSDILPGNGFSPERAEPYQQIQAWSERMSSWVPEGFSGYKLAGLLALSGLLWGVFSWRLVQAAPRPQQARGPEAMATHLFEGSISGEVNFPPSCELGKGTLTVSFPEVPCQFSAPWTEAAKGSTQTKGDNRLTHPQANQFVWKFKFLAAKSPTRCEVVLAVPGFRLSQPSTMVLGATNHIHLQLVPAPDSRQPPAIPRPK
jgi:hypothetical protein